VSQASQTVIDSAEDGPFGRSLSAEAIRRLRRDPVAVACFMLICIYALVALSTGGLAKHFKDSKDYKSTNQAPSVNHWLGTDVFGRDVFQKTLLGARVSMIVGLMANLIAIPLGLAFGVLAGYFGRFVDDVIVWFYNTLASIPGLILLIALKFAFQDRVLFEDSRLELDLGGIHGLYIALGIMSWVGTCRLVRAETIKIKGYEYVMAARASGQGPFRIIYRHIVPNLFHLAIINFTLGFVSAITSEVILSFLGLGVEVGTPSWGNMISEGRLELVVGRWWEVTSACGAMFVIVLALNLFGDRLRDALDPRLRT
jgi:peptide/nickel transport system permease protein